eukprot:jgi/Galph1/5297/GphlegSOOS_G3946.1
MNSSGETRCEQLLEKPSSGAATKNTESNTPRLQGVQVALEKAETKTGLTYRYDYPYAKYAHLFKNEQLSKTGANHPEYIEERKVQNGAVGELIRKYEKGKLLGKGGFAKVFQLKDVHTGRLYAGKIIPKNAIRKESAKQKLVSEIRIHRELRHRHIVKFESCFEDNDNVYIVLELCPNGSIMDMLRQRGRLTELETRYFMNQILSAVRYMHREYLVIHRDLKLGNFFLDENMEVKIGDFGLAAQLTSDKERKRTICGTPNYIAPEILSSKEGHSFEVDIWSMGVVLYTMLVGKPPFETSDVRSTYKRIKENIYTIPESMGLSPHAVELIGSILNSDPAKRLSLDEVCSHPFFDGEMPQYLPTESLKTVPKFKESDLLSRRSKTKGKSYIKNDSNLSEKDSLSKRKDTTDPIYQDQLAPLQKLQQQLGKEKKVPMTSENLAQELTNRLKISNDQGRWTVAKQSDNKQTTPVVATENKQSSQSRRDSQDDEQVLLNQAHEQLTSSFAQLKNMEQSPSYFTSSLQLNDGTASGSPSFHSPINALAGGAWVCKWVDYSSKYGLGYQTCLGTVGVCFNDGTKIVLEKGDQNILHYQSHCNSENSRERWTCLTLDNYPNELQKKVKLLIHFRNYMLDHTPKGQEDPLISPESSFQTSDSAQKTDLEKTSVTKLVYVRKWFRTNHAIVFRLSNRNIQVDFHDGTEIILSPEVHIVTYRGKDGRRTSYQQGHLPRIPELLKRLRYIMELLQEILESNHGISLETQIANSNK